jgi:uncharacterized protein YecT (DUF1311 family)
MKIKRILSVLLAFAAVLSTLAGCGFSKNKAAVSALESSLNSQSSQTAASSQADPSSAPSEPTVSSAASAVEGNQPTESQPGQVIVIETDDKAFDQLFTANPIDKAYIKESNNAFSSVDMVNVSNKYSGIWQKEIANAYTQLTNSMMLDSSKKPEALRTEQNNWVSGTNAALKKISDEELAKGGSMAQVNVASKVMDFYRSRAAQIYKELYAYDKNFKYEFKG